MKMIAPLHCLRSFVTYQSFFFAFSLENLIAFETIGFFLDVHIEIVQHVAVFVDTNTVFSSRAVSLILLYCCILLTKQMC